MRPDWKAIFEWIYRWADDAEQTVEERPRFLIRWLSQLQIWAHGRVVREERRRRPPPFKQDFSMPVIISSPDVPPGKAYLLSDHMLRLTPDDQARLDEERTKLWTSPGPFTDDDTATTDPDPTPSAASLRSALLTFPTPEDTFETFYGYTDLERDPVEGWRQIPFSPGRMVFSTSMTFSDQRRAISRLHPSYKIWPIFTLFDWLPA